MANEVHPQRLSSLLRLALGWRSAGQQLCRCPAKKQERYFHQSLNVCCDKQGNTENTRSPEEVEKFSSLSSQWWNISGEFIPLKALNRLRVPLVKNVLLEGRQKPISKPLRDLKILDVGCGGGLLSEPFARLGAQVTGIDPSEENIMTATAHGRNDRHVARNTTYLCSTVEELVESHKECFDAVVASEVIEHVNNQSLFVNSCAQLVKPGGHMFFTTINRSLLSLVFAKYAAEYVLGIVPADVHDWDKFVTTSEMTSMLRECDMGMIEFYGMAYNPLLKQWSWCDSTVINYACHAKKPIL